MPGTGDAGRLSQLEERVRDLTARVSGLERASPPAGPAAAAAMAGPASGEGDEAVLTYSGSGMFGPHRLRIQARGTLGSVLGADPDVVARVFAALASPVRLVLLRAMVSEPRTSQQLRDLLDAGSAGQLYHHLRELLAAGLVSQPGRSVYAIPRDKVVAVCVALMAAVHLMPAALQTAVAAGPQEQPRPQEQPSPREQPGPEGGD